MNFQFYKTKIFRILFDFVFSRLTFGSIFHLFIDKFNYSLFLSTQCKRYTVIPVKTQLSEETSHWPISLQKNEGNLHLEEQFISALG